MTKWMLAASAAALAITSPAIAQKGDHGGGNGGGNDKGQSARGGGGQKGGGGQIKAQHAEHGGGQMRVEHAQRQADHGMQHVDRQQGRGNGKIVIKDHGKGQANRADKIVARAVNRDVVRIETRGQGNRFVPRWNERGLAGGLIDGCPPGLAKKGNGCMPPGLARKVVGTALPAALSGRMLSGPYRDWYRDDANYLYRNDDDYIYRVNRDGGLIDALFPYQDRDYYYYPVGMTYPSDYNYYNVPYQYQGYYPDQGDYSYRYGDGAIYQVNRSNGVINGIAALLAGDLAVGQQLPSSYGAYNVPLSYRDRYYDTPNDLYRYNDGNIYRVDPATQLITAVISAII